MSVSAFRRRRAQSKKKGTWMKVKDGDRIRRWRKQRRFSQEQLAALVGCSQQFISQLENGVEKTCTSPLGVAIGAWLEVPWEELFDAEEFEIVPGAASSIESVVKQPRARGPHSRKLSA
jgi:transcriptional regulator with XRE-family HTH domain